MVTTYTKISSSGSAGDEDPSIADTSGAKTVNVPLRLSVGEKNAPTDVTTSLVYADESPGESATVNKTLSVEFESKSSARTNAGRAVTVESKIGPQVTGAGTGHYCILGEIFSYDPQFDGSHVVLNLANRKKNKATSFAIDATTNDENSWGAAADVTGATGWTALVTAA